MVCLFYKCSETHSTLTYLERLFLDVSKIMPKKSNETKVVYDFQVILVIKAIKNLRQVLLLDEKTSPKDLFFVSEVGLSKKYANPIKYT